MAPAPDFKRADADSYDAHVADFARFTEVLTSPLAVRMVSMAGVRPGQQVLDVGTGTGVVALRAARAAGSSGACVGVDLSEPMLGAARAAAAEAGLAAQVTFEAMDAESLAFEAGRFDVVVSLFALLHFPRPDAALKEMFRVLKPGGTLVVGVGSAPRWASWQGLAHAPGAARDAVAQRLGRQLVAPRFLDGLVEALVPATSAPEESELAHGGKNRTGGVDQLVRGAGFTGLREHWEGHHLQLTTAADFWDIQRTFSSFSRKRLLRATPEQLAKVRQRFDDGCKAVLTRGGQLTYPFAAFFIAATRP